MKILADDIKTEEAPFILSKLMEDIQRHNDILQGFDELSFIVLYDNSQSKEIFYDVKTKTIVEKDL